MRVRFLFLLALASCYAKTPPKRPDIDLPELSPDKQLRVVSGTERVETRYSYRTIPVTMVGYGDDPVSRGQLIRMTTPDWDAVGRRYDAARSRCKKFQAPRVIASALMFGSILFFYYGSSVIPDTRQRLYAGLAGWGAGLATYTFGYVVGGKICNDAAEIYDRYYLGADARKFYLDDEVKRVSQMVRDYNLKHPVAAASPD